MMRLDRLSLLVTTAMTATVCLSANPDQSTRDARLGDPHQPSLGGFNLRVALAQGPRDNANADTAKSSDSVLMNAETNLPYGNDLNEAAPAELFPTVVLGEVLRSENPVHCDDCYPGICRDPGWPRRPCLTRPGDRDWSDHPPLRYRMNDHKRAGKPLCYHRFAKPSITSNYAAGWVGGGTPCFGRPQCIDEGTWGMDYRGLFGFARVWLRWTKHHRYQGGEGAYKTDGRTKLAGLLKKG